MTAYRAKYMTVTTLLRCILYIVQSKGCIIYLALYNSVAWTSQFWTYAHYSKFPFIEIDVTFIKNFVIRRLAKLTAKPDFLTAYTVKKPHFD